jgi:hypothetical protein
MVLYHLDFPLWYAPSILHSLQSGVVLRWHENQEAYEKVIRTRAQGVFGWADKNGGVFQDAFSNKWPISPVMDYYFTEMLQLFAESNVPVLILAQPVNKATYDAILPNEREAFSSWLHIKAGIGPRITLTEPTFPVWPDDSFGDRGGHLNGRGATRATGIVAACISRIFAGEDCTRCPMNYNAF